MVGGKHAQHGRGNPQPSAGSRQTFPCRFIFVHRHLCRLKVFRHTWQFYNHMKPRSHEVFLHVLSLTAMMSNLWPPKCYSQWHWANQPSFIALTSQCWAPKRGSSKCHFMSLVLVLTNPSLTSCLSIFSFLKANFIGSYCWVPNKMT